MAAYHSIAVTLGQAGFLNELLTLMHALRKGAHRKILKLQSQDNEGRLEPDVVIYNAVRGVALKLASSPAPKISGVPEPIKRP